MKKWSDYREKKGKKNKWFPRQIKRDKKRGMLIKGEMMKGTWHCWRNGKKRIEGWMNEGKRARKERWKDGGGRGGRNDAKVGEKEKNRG